MSMSQMSQAHDIAVRRREASQKRLEMLVEVIEFLHEEYGTQTDDGVEISSDARQLYNKICDVVGETVL